MATCLFRSSLAFRLQSFLETRRAAGREDAATQKILIYLDRFLMSELKPAKPLTREIAEHWFKSIMAASSRIGSTKSLRPLVFSTLVGLLYSIPFLQLMPAMYFPE